MKKRNELREVIFLDEYCGEYKGFFHEWIFNDGVQAIVEDIDKNKVSKL